MALFKSRRPASPPVDPRQPFQITMELLEAIATKNYAVIDRAETNVRKLPIKDVLDAVGQLGLMIKPTMKPQTREKIRDALRDADGSPEVNQAVFNVGEALMIKADRDAYVMAMNELPDAGILKIMVPELLTCVGTALGQIGFSLKY